MKSTFDFIPLFKSFNDVMWRSLEILTLVVIIGISISLTIFENQCLGIPMPIVERFLFGESFLFFNSRIKVYLPGSFLKYFFKFLLILQFFKIQVLEGTIIENGFFVLFFYFFFFFI